MTAPTAELAQPREHFVELRGKRFHYLEWGDPQHPNLLLAHGGASSARGTWLLTAPAFADRFHIVAIDHRGHGETEWDPDGRYTLDEYAADLAAFVEALSLDPFFLIAHSMGGLISMAYAADHAATIRALVLVDAGLRFGDPPASPRPSPLLARPLKFDSRADAEAYARSMFPDAAQQRNVGYGFIDLPDGSVTWRTDVVGLSKSWQTRDAAHGRVVEAFGHIEFPVLLLRAGASAGITLETVEKMKAANPGLQVVTYESAHHWLHQDEPARFERDVSDFLVRAGGTGLTPIAMGGAWLGLWRGIASVAALALLCASTGAASAQQAPGTVTWQAGTGAAGDNTYLGGVDIPASGALLPVDRLLKVSGWFVDSTAQGWAGADDLQVFVGTMESGRSIARGTLGVPRADIAASLNNPFWASSGWTAVLDPGAMPQGQNTLSFYLHTPGKGWWYTQVPVRVGPTAGGVAGPLVDGTPPVVSVTWPREGDRASTLSRPWQLTGTALDPLAGAKAIDRVQVWLNGERNTLDATYLGDAVPDKTGAWMISYTPDMLSPLMSNLYVYVHSDVTGKTTLRVVHFEIVDRPL